MTLTKDYLKQYTGYETSLISDNYFIFVLDGIVSLINKKLDVKTDLTYDTFDPAVKLICLTLVADYFRSSQRLKGEGTSIKLDDLSINYTSLASYEKAMEQLETYKDVLYD